MEINATEKQIESTPSTPPTGFQVIWREFKKDRLAMLSLFTMVIIILGVVIASFFFDPAEVMKTSLRNKYAPPSKEFWLGADIGGSDIFAQLIIGAKNSLKIAVLVTIITSVVGIAIGLICGYFGGWVDNFFMRIIDFFVTLPTLMIIIVIVTITPKLTDMTLVLVISTFGWMGIARLVRSKALSEGRRDYINASKTLGTNNFVIILREMMPNLSSLLIVEMTLNFAGNIGIETGLTFLGFGLPPMTPSLGTLVSYANNPLVMTNYWWVWLPAALFILILMLSINYVGQALRRAADARQRLG